jgi:hypothetical protein
MNLKNTYLVITIIIIIVFFFIYHYDIYIIKKGEKLCENIMVEKKPNIDKNPINNENKIDDYFVSDIKYNNVINDVMKVLENIPTKLSQPEMLKIVSYLNKIYQKSPNIDVYLKKVKKMPNKFPYDTKYTTLVSNLIIKFDTKYTKKLNKIKKQKKVSFNENNNQIISIDNNSINKKETFRNLDSGEFTNYAPF